MKFIDYAKKLEAIKYIAAHKHIGTPCQLAQRLNISERTLQRMVQQLREQDFPIFFNRNRGCYEVKNDKSFLYKKSSPPLFGGEVF